MMLSPCPPLSVGCFKFERARIKALGWLFLAMPVMANCAICLTVGTVVSNLAEGRNYPQYW
eukprot:3722770-Rhodomonas_salina.1